MPLDRGSPLALTVLALLRYRPLHPYGIQRLLKQWGKDQVVNVGQRTGLYRTIDRLGEAGLIRVRETGRDQQYPERTVYEITDDGQVTLRRWLDEMLSVPRQEFPQFPAALSNALMLAPDELAQALERREQVVAGTLAALEEQLADTGVPRVAMLEVEYLRAVTEAEARWLRGVVEDLRGGRLTWSRESLEEAAAALE
ncbi:Transcriptional regulator, PadR family [[Actinomadura] parvosata subsp. kistnae]|uniref:PadR family transcriptional regulator n=1 Tax=[Actinomadura] parvosata subsp. kistnae TaxID=1909395 RepID=A0A1V0A755_9ACTN|nr:PadR family transcriptional regulator [Nonomuraea sp. ATCC 55076]AQZ66041.1 PadR family transcriptional regulator [Nonomuraea sp. ATCC 55076]SPL97517.1 Transcriptional regulator, PadR family [Actinomadura parvosata subsp. kistnae]